MRLMETMLVTWVNGGSNSRGRYHKVGVSDLNIFWHISSLLSHFNLMYYENL